MKNTTIALFLALNSAVAFGADVTNGSKQIITVENRVSDGVPQASFHFCSDKTKPETCKILGNREFYDIAALVDQRHWQQAKIAGASVADLAIVAGAFFGGWVAGGAAFASSPALVTYYYGAQAAAAEGIIVGSLSGTAVGIGTDVAAGSKWSALNPVEQYRRVKVIGDRVILDKPVVIKGSLYEFATRLDTVLKFID